MPLLRTAQVLLLLGASLLAACTVSNRQTIPLDPTPPEIAPVTTFRLGSPFSSHMVLQRDAPIPIWGTDRPGQPLRILALGRTWPARAGADGRWETQIGPFPAGGPYQIEISGSTSQLLEDVLAGEVWIASGQSNMEWPLLVTDGGEEEIARADHPQIRFVMIPHAHSPQPQPFVDNDGWRIVSPASVPYFSAVAYYFAVDLHQQLGVPIGIVANAWGGAGMEAYTPLDKMAENPQLAWTVEHQRASLEIHAIPRPEDAEPPLPEIQHIPALLYNAMVHPLAPLRARGVIWYQGETNAIRADQYPELSRVMIESWRSAFRDPDMPFLYVQLAGLQFGWESWPHMFDAQRRALFVPNTAMATAIDLGDPADIHPRNKRDVGLRLAVAARAMAYGQDIVYSGPLVTGATREGDRVRLAFGHVGSGFVTRSGTGEVAGFELAGADGVFHPAKASIDGATVVVSADAVPEPRRVRYDWKDFPDCDLRNREGLPASPFVEEVAQPAR